MKPNAKSLNQMMEQYERIVAMWKDANPGKRFKGQRAHRIGEAKRNDRIKRGFSLFTQDRDEQRAIITTC